MKPKAYAVVIAQDGVQGLIEINHIKKQNTEVYVTLTGSQSVLIPTAKLHLRDNGTYFFPKAFTHFIDSSSLVSTSDELPASNTLSIPVIIEEAQINKEWHETGRVRVTKTGHDIQQTIHELLQQEHVTVERIVIDQIVEAMPSARQEGNTFIVPLVDEELVVVKCFRLKEEIRITKHISEAPVTELVTLRKEDVVVERTEGSTEN